MIKSVCLLILLVIPASFSSNIYQIDALDYNEITDTAKPLSPVIFVPGDGGSQVDAKLDKPAVVHYICDKKTADYFNIWLNMELLVPLVIDCWVDNMKLNYDNVTRKTTNQPGVTLRFPGWGLSETVEWLDPSHASAGAYFKDIGNALVSLGYQRNVSLRGAPYDFRKAPNENKKWFLDFKDLIEETYKMNGNVSVTLVAHSMGGPMSLLFLQQQSQGWKDKYIAKLITIAGAWGGSMKAMKVFAMGDDLGSHFLQGNVLRGQQITSPSLAWLMPSPIFWKPDEVLIITKSRNYTFAQLEQYFIDLNYTTGWEMRKDTLPYSKDFTPPGVEVHCIYGQNMTTVEQLYYKTTDVPIGNPDLLSGDGDGTVNFRSLSACELWKTMQKQPVTTLVLPNAEHIGVLSDSRAIKYLIELFAL